MPPVLVDRHHVVGRDLALRELVGGELQRHEPGLGHPHRDEPGGPGHQEHPAQRTPGGGTGDHRPDPGERARAASAGGPRARNGNGGRHRAGDHGAVRRWFPHPRRAGTARCPWRDHDSAVPPVSRFLAVALPLVASPAEDSHSGLVRTIGNRVGIKPSGVQIPHPPPHDKRHRAQRCRLSCGGTGRCRERTWPGEGRTRAPRGSPIRPQQPAERAGRGAPPAEELRPGATAPPPGTSRRAGPRAAARPARVRAPTH